jgi:hypothetical protein
MEHGNRFSIEEVDAIIEVGDLSEESTSLVDVRADTASESDASSDAAIDTDAK